MKNLINVCTIISIITLTACKSTSKNSTWDAEVNAELTTNEVSYETSQEIQKVQYLARNLMGARAQEFYRADMAKEVIDWNMASVSVGFIGSSLITNNPFSTSGAGTAASIGLGLDVLTFFADGSADDIAQFWMPSVSELGVKYTEETATNDARKEVVGSLISTYKEFGIELTCYSKCEELGEFRTYTGTISQELTEKLKSKGYVYVPKEVQITTWLHDLHKIHKEDVVETLALGFKPGFTSNRSSFTVHMTADIKYLEGTDKPLRFEYEGTDGLTGYQTKYPLMKTKLGRDLMKSFTKKVPWVYGTDNRKKGRYVSYNGKLYSWNIATSTKFIEEEILN